MAKQISAAVKVTQKGSVAGTALRKVNTALQSAKQSVGSLFISKDPAKAAGVAFKKADIKLQKAKQVEAEIVAQRDAAKDKQYEFKTKAGVVDFEKSKQFEAKTLNPLNNKLQNARKQIEAAQKVHKAAEARLVSANDAVHSVA